MRDWTTTAEAAAMAVPGQDARRESTHGQGRARKVLTALADTRFTELATPRLLRPTYVTALVVAAVVALRQMIDQVVIGVDALRFGEVAEGIVRVIAGVLVPAACWFLVAAVVRMLLEVVVVVLDGYGRRLDEGDPRAGSQGSPRQDPGA